MKITRTVAAMLAVALSLGNLAVAQERSHSGRAVGADRWGLRAGSDGRRRHPVDTAEQLKQARGGRESGSVKRARALQNRAIAVLACPEGLEPPTPSLEGWCSIQLSYGQLDRVRTLANKSDGRGGGIRTRDLLVPNQLRYQAALRPEGGRLYAACWQRQAPPKHAAGAVSSADRIEATAKPACRARSWRWRCGALRRGRRRSAACAHRRRSRPAGSRPRRRRRRAPAWPSRSPGRPCSAPPP